MYVLYIVLLYYNSLFCLIWEYFEAETLLYECKHPGISAQSRDEFCPTYPTVKNVPKMHDLQNAEGKKQKNTY